MIKVLKPGLATSVQDLGREGYYHLGIPPSGALDQYALLSHQRAIAASRSRGCGSTSVTDRPLPARLRARLNPAGPAPTTSTSTLRISSSAFALERRVGRAM